MKAMIILDLDDKWMEINKFTLDELFADITLYEKKALNGQCDYQKRVYRCFDGCLKPMPQKKEVKEIKHFEDIVNIKTHYDLIEEKIVGQIKYDTETIFNEGYNSCLDEIQGKYKKRKRNEL